jgi:curli biogenesis system outer membrane secretion channel CsgG
MRFIRALVSIAAVLAMATTLAAQKSLSKEERAGLPRVAVLKFPCAPGCWSGWRHGGWGHQEEHIANVLQELFVTELSQKGKGKLRVIERERLSEIRNELSFQQSGEVDSSTVQKIGKLLGVKYMITGKVTRFAYKESGFSSGWGVGALVSKVTGSGLAGSVAGSADVKKASFTGRLDVRLIEVETGEILETAKDEGSTSDMSVKVAGTGNEIEYDEEMVNKIFEPIVEKMAPKFVRAMSKANAED